MTVWSELLEVLECLGVSSIMQELVPSSYINISKMIRLKDDAKFLLCLPHRSQISLYQSFLLRHYFLRSEVTEVGSKHLSHLSQGIGIGILCLVPQQKKTIGVQFSNVFAVPRSFYTITRVNLCSTYVAQQCVAFQPKAGALAWVSPSLSATTRCQVLSTANQGTGEAGNNQSKGWREKTEASPLATRPRNTTDIVHMYIIYIHT